MNSFVSGVRFNIIDSVTQSNKIVSNLKTYAFAIAILLGCVGLVIGLVGLGIYLQTGILSIKSFTMMIAGGGGGVFSLIAGILGAFKNRSQKSYLPSCETPYNSIGNSRTHEESCVSPTENSYLSNSSVSRCLSAVDLAELFPTLQIIDEQTWTEYVDLEAYGLSFDELQPLDKRETVQELFAFSFLPIEDDAGFTLLTIPKGFSLNKLIEIAGSLQQGKETPFKYISQPFKQESGDNVTNKACRMLISNSILAESRQKTLNEHLELVQNHACEMPNVLDASTLIVLTFMTSRKRLYTDNPATYTRCSDTDADWSMVVGHFSSAGFYVYECLDTIQDGHTVGTAAIKKFA